MTAFATEPRPPPSELPPSTAAVSADDFEADAGIGAGAAEARGEQEARERAQQADDQT